jgi:hypothetical protein
MQKRKHLSPNNGGRKKAMVAGVARAKFPKSNEKPSIYTWARAGRQNSEGFGGGRIVGTPPK